jgi:hypothetical protein
MKTPEEIEKAKTLKDKRDRKLFYWGMLAGSVLTFIMILINRIWNQ